MRQNSSLPNVIVNQECLLIFKDLIWFFVTLFNAQKHHINRGAIVSKPVVIVNEKAF